MQHNLIDSSPVAAGAQRAAWLKTLLQWHWISSALCLVCLLLFSVTGITLNHASQIEAKPQVTRYKAVAPAAVLASLRAFAGAHDGAKAALPPDAAAWVAQAMPVKVDGVNAEWSADEMVVPLPRPGGDAWLRVGLADGATEYERTDRGWISWANDLHKGRNTGPAWSWFIDIFAAACLVFAISGFLILKVHAAKRALTWPMVGAGLLVPALIALLFIH